MKRFGTYLLAAFVAIAACSCEREIDNVSVSVKSVIANTDNNITKTALESLSVVWENKDAITVFDNSSASHTSNALDLAETSSNVTFSVPGMSSTDQVIAAVYPADDAASFDGTNIITTFPSSQSAKDGSFGTGANVAVADAETVSGLQFKNVGGILALGITSDVADEITSVEISANEMMAGPVKINAANQTVTANGDGSKSVTINGTFVSGGKYYFAVLPGTYTGLKIVFTRSNGYTATYSNSNALTVARNGNILIGNITIADAKWENSSIGNTIETAYTAEQARALIDAGNNLETAVYVKGVVSSVAWSDLTQYGNADITLEGEDSFKFYRCYDLGNKKFSEKYVASKDTVIAYGTLLKHVSQSNVETYELAQGCYLVEYKKYIIRVTSVTLPSTMNMEVGQGADMAVVVKPSNATNSTLSWTSSSSDIVSVGDDGHVVAVAEGTATITASTTDGTNISASCVITVKPVVEVEPSYPEVCYDFSKIDGFSDWGSSYAPHIVEYENATVSFASANKAATTVTDVPVTKGGAVTVLMKNNARINSFFFVCKQWSDKAQTIKYEVTSDGTNWSQESTTSGNFFLAISSLPAVKGVRFSFSSTSNQVGISKFYVNSVPQLEDASITIDNSLSVQEASQKDFSFITDYDGSLTVTTSNSSIVPSVSGKTLTISAVNAKQGDTAEITLSGPVTARYNAFSKKVSVTVGAPAVGKVATLAFGSASGSTPINSANVKATDSEGNVWTVTTAGTSSFTQNSSYSQLGSSGSPASTITLTTALPNEALVSAFSVKFGGFSGTSGSVTLKVGDSTVGSGSLNAQSDVIVSNTSNVKGKLLTITVTGISKGVKCYSLSVTYE